MLAGLGAFGPWALALLALEILAQLGCVLLVLLRPQSRQSSSLAWILVLLLLPVLGIVAYLLFGEVRLGLWRHEGLAEVGPRMQAALTELDTCSPAAQLPPVHAPLAALAGSVGRTVPRGGNALELFGETDEVLRRLCADIDAAEHTAHLLFYIYIDDGAGRAVGEALMRACARGVQARLLCDAVGSRRFLESDLRARLEAGGVRVVAALPTRLLPFLASRLDLRNHRKIAVLDGRVAYTGSQNVAEASFALKPRFAPWIDATVRVEGPAALDLGRLFAEDWFLDADEDLSESLILPDPEPGGVAMQVVGTGPGAHNAALVQVLQAAIHLAREEVLLTTPYFVPDEGTLAALVTAAARGVEVTLVLPQRSDSWLTTVAGRSMYEELLDAGVEIHLFTGGLLHSKTMTVDRELGIVTTANLDRRSFEINLEASALVYDTDFASQLRLLQKTYLDGASPVDAGRWRRRPWWRRMTQNLAGLMGPLL